jgi:hypothetical protein
MSNTSGTFGWDPLNADLFRECFERALIDPALAPYNQIESAIRSANFVMQALSNAGAKQYEMQFYDYSTIQGTPSYVFPQMYLRPFTSTRRRAGVDIPVLNISRWDYEDIPNKLVYGAPSECFWDASGAYAGSPRTMYLWPNPENSTDVMRHWMIRSPEIITSLGETAPISTEWLDAFCDGVALRIAKKFNPAAVQQNDMVNQAMATMQAARQADRETAPARFRMSARGRRGWR